jgi:molybdenum cofactor guanylyltransferase
MPKPKLHDITGIILVGGKSRRMGQDKAFMKVGGVAIFDRILAVFRESFERVLLVGDREERFAGYHLPVVPDIYPGSALGGLYTGLYRAETEYVFVASCDLPYPSAELLRHLCSLKEGYDAVVPVPAHGYEPLFAVYSKRCLQPIRELLESGDFCAYAYYPQVNIRYVPESEFTHLCPEGKCFVNVNTPEEFQRLERGPKV